MKYEKEGCGGIRVRVEELREVEEEKNEGGRKRNETGGRKEWRIERSGINM
jgi:hypothetical protein